MSKISNAFAHTGQEKRDNSLRGNAMRRARSGNVPKTLTPWEWHEWYGEHGMPQEFAKGANSVESSKWNRFMRKLMRRS